MITELKQNQVKDILGYEGLYSISSDGMVWSYPKINGKNSHHKGRYLIPHLDGQGYYFVALSKNKIKYQPKLHRLIAEAFIPNVMKTKVVNHIDGNKQNNNISNLEWVTQSENVKHSFKLGMSNQKGSKNACAKLNENNVITIRGLQKKGIKQNSLAKEYGVSCSIINRIVKNLIWTHI